MANHLFDALFAPLAGRGGDLLILPDGRRLSGAVFLDLVARGLLWACGKLDAEGKPLPGFESQQK